MTTADQCSADRASCAEKPWAQKLSQRTPETAAVQVNEGKVLATGPGRRNLTNGETIPMSVKEGDKVLLPEYGGQTLRLDGTE